jgi:hypothetical protein
MTRLILVTTLAMLAFAGNSLLCRVALRDTAIDAASFTTIRLASGALVLALIVGARERRLPREGSWPAAACLFGYAAAFSFAYRELSACWSRSAASSTCCCPGSAHRRSKALCS